MKKIYLNSILFIVIPCLFLIPYYFVASEEIEETLDPAENIKKYFRQDLSEPEYSSPDIYEGLSPEDKEAIGSFENFFPGLSELSKMLSGSDFCYTFSKNIKVQNSETDNYDWASLDPDIIALTSALEVLGLYKGGLRSSDQSWITDSTKEQPVPDFSFHRKSPLVEAAIKFQKQYGNLDSQDGNVGPKSIKKLNQLFKCDDPLRIARRRVAISEFYQTILGKIPSEERIIELAKGDISINELQRELLLTEKGQTFFKKISQSSKKPALQIVTPKDNEEMEIGSIQLLSWLSYNTQGIPLSIEIFSQEENKTYIIQDKIYHNGSFIWNINQTLDNKIIKPGYYILFISHYDKNGERFALSSKNILLKDVQRPEPKTDNLFKKIFQKISGTENQKEEQNPLEQNTNVSFFKKILNVISTPFRWFGL